MKASTKRSTGIRKPSRTATERVYAQYVKDLRSLLMQSAQREEKLAAMVKAVIDERFFRPEITSDPGRNRQSALDVDADVTVFSEEVDQELMKTQQDAAAELGKLYREQFGEEPPSERHQEDLVNA